MLSHSNPFSMQTKKKREQKSEQTDEIIQTKRTVGYH